MKPAEVRRLYDSEYAAIYNESFLLGEHFRESTDFEESLIKQLLHGATSWLDVACGTGYFLSRFPEVNRTGMDISPAMLEAARRANPKVTFYEHDFRDEMAEMGDRWDLVSCTWYAYCYAESVAEIEGLVRNLASWTSPDGTCFLPICDPDVLCKTKIPYNPPSDSDDGRLVITGIVWTWVDQPSGRTHGNLVAPHSEHMLAIFGKFFSDVAIVKYPRFRSDCLAARSAIIAKKKLLADHLKTGLL